MGKHQGIDTVESQEYEKVGKGPTEIHSDKNLEEGNEAPKLYAFGDDI